MTNVRVRPRAAEQALTEAKVICPRRDGDTLRRWHMDGAGMCAASGFLQVIDVRPPAGAPRRCESTHVLPAVVLQPRLGGGGGQLRPGCTGR